MEKVVGPLIAIAFLALAGLGLYAYNLNNDLDQAHTMLAKAQQNRDEYKKSYEDISKKATAGVQALASCNTQLQDATTKLDAAMSKKPVATKAAAHR